MPTIVLDGTGPTKAALVEGAYEFCGLSAEQYELTPEEMTKGLRWLNRLAQSLLTDGIDLGYDLPVYGQGLLEEPSGIPEDAAEPISVMLAQRLAPTIGATLTDDAKAILANARTRLYSKYAAAPPSMVPASIPWSAGTRHRRFIVSG